MTVHQLDFLRRKLGAWGGTIQRVVKASTVLVSPTIESDADGAPSFRIEVTWPGGGRYARVFGLTDANLRACAIARDVMRDVLRARGVA